MTTHDIALMIDHAVLHPMHTDADLQQACAIGDRWQVATICVKPYHVLRTTELLSGSTVKPCAVVGFPHGSNTVIIKHAEASLALQHGASEIDMVVNIGKVIQGDWGYVDEEIAALQELCAQQSIPLKVIFEMDFLSDDAMKIELCNLCNRHGVAFAKTSTGFGFVSQPDGHYDYTGATEHDVALMRRHCLPEIGIKASGGIRSLDALLRFHALGATRIGTSSTEKILKEAKARFG